MNSKVLCTSILILFAYQLGAQELKTWDFGLDFAFGITSRTHSLDASLTRADFLAYEKTDKLSHGLLAQFIVRRNLNERWRLRSGLCWKDLTTKRTYKSIAYKSGTDPQIMASDLPNSIKIRTTYGFLSFPLAVEMHPEHAEHIMIEAGAAFNWNMYSKERESEKTEGTRIVTQERYFKSAYSPYSVNAHVGLKLKLASGEHSTVVIGPNYDVFFQTLHLGESGSEAARPGFFYLSAGLIF